MLTTCAAAFNLSFKEGIFFGTDASPGSLQTLEAVPGVRPPSSSAWVHWSRATAFSTMSLATACSVTTYD